MTSVSQITIFDINKCSIHKKWYHLGQNAIFFQEKAGFFSQHNCNLTGIIKYKNILCLKCVYPISQRERTGEGS